MIELTAEQIEAIGALNGGLRELVNPRTHETFVLVPHEEYDRLIGDGYDYDDSPWTKEELDALNWELAERLGWEDWDDETEQKAKP